MKINPIFINFKGATLNINSFSDSHGRLENLGDFFEIFKQNKKDLFLQDKAGVKNVTAIAGDWFMAGNVRGYLSQPKYNSQRFQLIFLNKFIKETKRLCASAITVFTVGNHEFDAGFYDFERCIRKMDAQVVATNVDFKNSKKSLQNEILKSYTIEIQDDKNPDLTHKALFLGVTSGNMKYYNRRLFGIDFIDNVAKAQATITKKDVQNTVNLIVEEINKFKKVNPKGAVILLDHFGGTFQEELLKQEKRINVILGAHEHKDYEEYRGTTLIAMLSQNFKKLQNIKLGFDDDGNVVSLQAHSYYSKKAKEKNAMHKFFEKIFAKDLRLNFSIPVNDDTKVLDTKGIRYQNSYLANFITDAILNRIRKKYPQTDFFAINASAIRGSLFTKNGGNVNNIDLLTTLNGIKDDEAEILISKMTGEQILDIILENLIANSISREKNPLLHYSGLKINKTLLLNGAKLNIPKKELINFITITKTGEPLRLDEEYTFANVEKFFIKSKNPLEKEIYTSSNTIKTGLNAKKEFRAHFFENIDEVSAKSEIRIIS